MNKDFSAFPHYFLDWLSERNFSELNPAEQAEVLQFLSMEEYDDMRTASLWAEDQARLREREKTLKADLFKHFDQLHASKKSLGIYQSNWMWKAAAVFFFTLSALMGYLWQQEQGSGMRQIQLAHDTIYLEKKALDTGLAQAAIPIVNSPSPQSRAHKNLPKKEIVKPRKLNRPVTEAAAASSEFVYSEETSLGDLPVLNAASALTNRSKRNSRKYDSLDKNFQYVSL